LGLAVQLGRIVSKAEPSKVTQSLEKQPRNTESS
jgi:hypothetical protein